MKSTLTGASLHSGLSLISEKVPVYLEAASLSVICNYKFSYS